MCGNQWNFWRLKVCSMKAQPTVKMCFVWSDHFNHTSSKSVSWGGRGGGRHSCINIGYSEPTRAESREGSPRRRELSGDVMTTRVLLAADSGDVLLDSGALGCRVGKTRAESRVNVLRWAIAFGSSSQCIEIWKDSFSALCDNFRHCETFSKNNQKILAAPPARIINTRADTDMNWCYVKRVYNNLKKLIRMNKNGQKRDINCTFTYKDYM